MAVYATQGLPILALTANVAAGPTYLRESSELVETVMVEHPGTLGRGSGPSSPPPLCFFCMENHERNMHEKAGDSAARCPFVVYGVSGITSGTT